MIRAVRVMVAMHRALAVPSMATRGRASRVLAHFLEKKRLGLKKDEKNIIFVPSQLNTELLHHLIGRHVQQFTQCVSNDSIASRLNCVKNATRSILATRGSY